MDIKISFDGQYQVKDTTNIGTVKILMLKGEKGDDAPADTYLPLTGGTLTGDLTLQSGNPYVKLKFTENSYIMNEASGRFGVQGNLRMRSGSIDMNSHGITNVSDPANAQDAANKQYVDASSSSSATIDGTGLISYKNSSGTTLFTLQLPLYNGEVV